MTSAAPRGLAGRMWQNGSWSNGRDRRSRARRGGRLWRLCAGRRRPISRRNSALLRIAAMVCLARRKTHGGRRRAGSTKPRRHGWPGGRRRPDHRVGDAGETGGFPCGAREPGPSSGVQHCARAGAGRRRDRQDRLQGRSDGQGAATCWPRSTPGRSRPLSTRRSPRRRRTRPRSPTPSSIWPATRRSPSKTSPRSSNSTHRTRWSIS